MKILSKNSRVFLYSLMLLALMVRSVVPVGFMPSQGRNGKVEIVICTGSGPATMLMDTDKIPAITHDMPAGHAHDGQHGGKDGNSGSRLSCPYAPVLAQGLPGVAPVALPAVIYKDEQSFMLAASVPSGIVLKPWFSQGPPVS